MAVYSKHGRRLAAELARIDPGCYFEDKVFRIRAVPEDRKKEQVYWARDWDAQLQTEEIKSVDQDSKNIYFAMSPKGSRIMVPKEFWEVLYGFIKAKYTGSVTVNYSGGEITDIKPLAYTYPRVD